jgi:hypothetical protein
VCEREGGRGGESKRFSERESGRARKIKRERRDRRKEIEKERKTFVVAFSGHTRGADRDKKRR